MKNTSKLNIAMKNTLKEKQDKFYKDLGEDLNFKENELKLKTLYGLTSKIKSLDNNIISKRTFYNYLNGNTKVNLYKLICLLKNYDNELIFKHDGDFWKLNKLED